MKKTVFYLMVCLSFVCMSACNILNNAPDPTPANDTGSISAKFNGTSWSGTWATSLIANLGNIQVLTINGQISEKITTEAVVIGISSFTGIGTYNYGGANDKVTFSAKFQNKGYTINTLAGGGGTGTIKITEFVKANGILNPGKAVGEFSGTVKSIDSNDVLTITSGKFNSVIVL
jgi:hypothetical protein